MGNVIACVTEVKEKSLRICKRDWKLMKADWKWVMSKISLNDPYEGGLYVSVFKSFPPMINNTFSSCCT